MCYKSNHDPNHALALHCTVCGFLDGTIRACGPVDNVFTVGLLASMYGEDVALQTAGTQKSVVFRDIARQRWEGPIHFPGRLFRSSADELPAGDQEFTLLELIWRNCHGKRK